METENLYSEEVRTTFSANLSSYVIKIFGTVILKSFFKTNKVPKVEGKNFLLYVDETINHLMTVARKTNYLLLEPIAQYQLFNF